MLSPDDKSPLAREKFRAFKKRNVCKAFLKNELLDIFDFICDIKYDK